MTIELEYRVLFYLRCIFPTLLESKNKRSASDRCLKGESSHGRTLNKAPKTESILVACEIDAQSNRDSDEDGRANHI